MSLVFQCRCGSRGMAGEKLAGKIVTCKQCGCKLRIPNLPQSPSDVEPEEYGLREELARAPSAPRTVAPSRTPGQPRSRTTETEKTKEMRSFRLSLERPSSVTDYWRLARSIFALIVAFILILGMFTGGGGSGPLRSLFRAVSGPDPAKYKNLSLTEARQGFQTKLARNETAGEPVDPPPPDIFRVVPYPSKVGDLAAYLTPDPGDGQKRPAIVWITGGDCNTIGNVWDEADPRNDQTACAFREAGIIMMFPSLRGGNVNPGYKEGFFGEVDDVLAATDFLARQAYVDPKRIYLGGHSTGGTLVLLVAAVSDRYRAVFSFGPADDVRFYLSQFIPFDRSNDKESALRSPGYWIHSVRSPTFVIEGTDGSSNIGALQSMSRASTNPQVRFRPLPGTNHFSVLDPVTRILATKVVRDTGPVTNITVSKAELNFRPAR